jgi:RNA polymerase sigma-70 factor (ECF subfamily)
MAFPLDPLVYDRAVAGDHVALESLLRDLQPRVARQLMRYPVGKEDRDDLLQATMLKVLRGLGSFRGESSFATWLFRVTANEALMLMRSERRRRARLVEGLDLEELAVLPAMSTSEQGGHGDFGVANRQRDARVREALDELPASGLRLVMARYYRHLPLDDIAGRFDISESAVRSRLHRARARLRSLLKETPIGREMMEAGARCGAATRSRPEQVASLA